MYNQPFFMPNAQMIRAPLSMASAPLNMARAPLNIARTASAARGGAGLFSKLGGAFSGLKSINWGGLINNTSRTLGIINQAIPLVRQVGPMMNNMKSMLRVASVFKDETDTKPTKQKNTTNINNNPKRQISTTNTQQLHQETQTEKESINYDNSPTFFINT